MQAELKCLSRLSQLMPLSCPTVIRPNCPVPAFAGVCGKAAEGMVGRWGKAGKNAVVKESFVWCGGVWCAFSHGRQM